MADNIPDVDLSSIKEELEATEPEKTDLGQFKSEADLLKGYKEIQAAFTRVSQENKALKEQGGSSDKIAELESQLQQMREEAEMLKFQAQASPNIQGSKSFDESWMESPEATIGAEVEKRLAVARINDALAAEEAKNPDEYPERYKIADALAVKHPQLAKNPQGVKMLFKMADKMREKSLRETSKKTMEFLREEYPDFDKFLRKEKKSKQDNDAYMPDGSTSTRSSADDDTDADRYRRAEKAVESGDVDGVLGEMFRDILE